MTEKVVARVAIGPGCSDSEWKPFWDRGWMERVVWRKGIRRVGEECIWTEWKGQLGVAVDVGDRVEITGIGTENKVEVVSRVAPGLWRELVVKRGSKVRLAFRRKMMAEGNHRRLPCSFGFVFEGSHSYRSRLSSLRVLSDRSQHPNQSRHI